MSKENAYNYSEFDQTVNKFFEDLGGNQKGKSEAERIFIWRVAEDLAISEMQIH